MATSARFRGQKLPVAIAVLLAAAVPSAPSCAVPAPRRDESTSERGFYPVHEGQTCNGRGAPRSRGNGFVVGKNLIMTAAHMLPENNSDPAKGPLVCPEPLLTLRRSGKCLDAKIVMIDRDLDIMVLAAPVTDPAFTIAATMPEMAEPVAKYGYIYNQHEPGYDFTRQSADIFEMRIAFCASGRANTYFKMRGPFPLGTSGSALFDRNGAVAGMVVRANQDSADRWGVAVSAPTLRHALETARRCKKFPCLADPCR